MTYQKTEKDRERNRKRKAEWYKENRKTQYARIKANQQRLKAIIKDYVNEIKIECERCGFDNPLALEFHHKDPTLKLANICGLHLKGWGMEKVKAEIAKCEIICANCHRIEHKPRPVFPRSDKALKG